MSQVTDQLGGFQKSAQKVSGAVKGLFVGLAVGQAVNAIKSVVSAASDAQQSLGATQTVFGKFADSVVTDSKRAATQFGLDANTYRENANLLGSLFSNQGVAAKRLSGATKEMISVGADLSATFGGTTTDAVAALSSAFKGEFDSLEKYGISLKESTISAELAARGQDKLTGSALAAAKQQVTSDLIMKQSKKTRGAFAKETNTLAHQQQVLSAQFTNLKATIGTALLPIFTKVLTFLNANLIPAFKRLKPALGVAKDAFARIGEALQPVGEWFSKHPELIKGAGIALGIAAAAAAVFAIAMGAVALATSPIVLTVVAIAAVGAAIAYAYKNSETFRKGVDTLVERLKAFGAAVLPIVQQVAAAFLEKWSVIAPYVMQAFESIKSAITDAMAIIAIVIESVTGVIQGIWQRFGGTILAFVTGTFQNIIAFVSGIMTAIAGVIKVVLSVLKGDWKGAWNGIKQILSGVWQAIKAVVSQSVNVVKTAISSAWTVVKSLTSAAWSAIKNAVVTQTTSLIGFVRGIPGKITGALSGLVGKMFSIGINLIKGMLNGVKSMASSLANAAKDVAEGAINGVKGMLGIKSPSRVFKKIGEQTVAGFIIGVRGGTSATVSAIQNLYKKAINAAGKGVSKAKKARAISSTADEAKRLKSVAKAYESLNKRLSDAKKNLEDLKKARSDYAASVRDSVLAFGSVTNLNAAFNSDAMLQQMQARITKVKQFASVLANLKSLGLNNDMYDDLVKAGVEGGLATAQALAAGGPEAIAQFNALQAELNKTATNLGNTTAGTMYDAGIQAATGLVKGLNAQAKALEKAAKNLAVAMVRAIKKALGIKSPSRVFRQLGEYTVEGMQIGLKDTSGVQRQMVNLSKVMTGSFDPVLATTATAANGAAAPVISITVNVPPTADKAAIGREVAGALDAYYKQGGRRAAL